jgi:hypothetical protein
MTHERNYHGAVNLGNPAEMIVRERAPLLSCVPLEAGLEKTIA